jgi:hypothetical protein
MKFMQKYKLKFRNGTTISTDAFWPPVKFTTISTDVFWPPVKFTTISTDAFWPPVKFTHISKVLLLYTVNSFS